MGGVGVGERMGEGMGGGGGGGVGRLERVCACPGEGVCVCRIGGTVCVRVRVGLQGGETKGFVTKTVERLQ